MKDYDERYPVPPISPEQQEADVLADTEASDWARELSEENKNG
jgi:hypothetical protein